MYPALLNEQELRVFFLSNKNLVRLTSGQDQPFALLRFERIFFVPDIPLL